MPDGDPTHCPSCGKPYTAGQVLLGWRPCRCRGHATWWCRDDTGGCGHTHHLPELQPDCRDVRFGY